MGAGRGTGWRDRSVDAAVAASLLVLGALFRLPLAPMLDTTGDSLDPIRQAYWILHGAPLVGKVAGWVFGYGRELSYLPLLLGRPEGLVGVAVRRALLQAAVPAVAYLAARAVTRRGEAGTGGRIGPLVSAAVLAAHPGLLDTLVSGHRTYLAVEWGAVASVALVGLLTGRAKALAAATLGLALPMMAMNHPAATAATAAVGPVGWVVVARSGRRGALGLLAGGSVAAAVAWPHGAALLRGRAMGLGDSVHGVTGDGMPPSEVLARLLGAGEPLGALPWAVAPLALLVGLAGTRWGRYPDLRARAADAAALGAAATASLVLLCGLAFGLRFFEPYYVRPFLPLVAVAGGAALAVAMDLAAPRRRGSGGAIGLPRRIRSAGAYLGLAALAAAALVPARGWPGMVEALEAYGSRDWWASTRAQVASRLDDLGAEGPWNVAFFGREPTPELMDRLLRGDPASRFAVTGEELREAPVLVAIHADEPDIEVATALPRPPGIRFLDRAWGTAILAARDARAVRDWTRGYCGPTPLPMRGWMGPDMRMTVALAGARGVIPGEPAFVHPCNEALAWARIDLPSGVEVRLPDKGSGTVAMPPRSFSIARLETARRDWGRCVAGGGCAPGAEAGDPWAPVTGVSAAEAEAYCARLAGRLPDAVEWQAAGWWTPAHDGLRRRPWGSGAARGRANLSGGADGYDGMAPVGSFLAGASAFGVEDLVGNAAEWVRAVEAETGTRGAVWVAGGSWAAGEEGAEAGVFTASDGKARPDVGFRCVKD